AADAIHDRAEERQVKHGVLDERAHVAPRWMIAPHRVHHHRAVVGQRAGVIADEQRASLGGNVLDAERLDAEPSRIEELEQPLPGAGRGGAGAEIGAATAAPPHRGGGPPPPHRFEWQPLTQIDRKRRRALLLDTALELAQLAFTEIDVVVANRLVDVIEEAE